MRRVYRHPEAGRVYSHPEACAEFPAIRGQVEFTALPRRAEFNALPRQLLALLFLMSMPLVLVAKSALLREVDEPPKASHAALHIIAHSNSWIRAAPIHDVDAYTAAHKKP
jgi:hypothetical protein